ncbi:MAG: hypothetical protein QOF78_1666 [Phycisphaerales bacterium]|jgi:hypothetical protein|nr:hypothetical protein [Phycisphaerales bacterium]
MFIAIVLAALCAAAAAPADNFNVSGQHRTRICVEMKGEKIPLRFADGTPTGFFALARDPSKQGGNKPCPVGCLEIDAHEIITTASGMKLLFHPGGGPGHYQDHVENGQYGHVALDDLKSRPTMPKPLGLNGKPAGWKNGTSYLITPTRIPRDMWYKPNVSDEGRSGSVYFTYGNPGYDKTNGRGDWTYINWSWVQNGGEKYPENICRGGGMVRAIGRRDMKFTAADVAPIIGYSYGADNNVNGRVTAFYGKTHAGPGDGGSEIFGWLPQSYQQSGDIIVPCVRRSPAAKAVHGKSSQDKDQMVRMAINLLSESPIDPPQRSEMVKMFGGELDPAARMERLTELSRMDDRETVNRLLFLLSDEKDARIREQAIVLIGFMRSTPGEMKRVCDGLLKNFQRSGDPRERRRTIEIVGNIPATESREFLKAVRATARGDEVKAVDDAIARLANLAKN